MITVRMSNCSVQPMHILYQAIPSSPFQSYAQIKDEDGRKPQTNVWNIASSE